MILILKLKLLHTVGGISWQSNKLPVCYTILYQQAFLLVQQFPSGIQTHITEFYPTLKDNSLLNHHLTYTFTVKESSLQALHPI